MGSDDRSEISVLLQLADGPCQFAHHASPQHGFLGIYSAAEPLQQDA